MINSIALKMAKSELKKRKAPPTNVLTECFDKQLEFIKDPSKRKKLCLTRRCGKSTTVGLYLIQEALNHPRSKFIYVGLTKETAKSVMWTEIFENIILKLNVPAKLVGLQIKFENGSSIQLTGADATYKEKHKLRGQKNRVAVIDECQSFTQDLKELVESVILPTLADLDGTLCMIGTPGNEQGLHYWWQINDPKNQTGVWKDFQWTWKDNPFARDKVKTYLDEITSKDPNIVNTTSYRQEWLGEWVIEDNARVYKATKEINYIDSLPYGLLNNNSIYLLSVDLGYVDATAFVVSCYNQSFDNKMYVLESKKISKLTISAVADKIKEYENRYKFRKMVVDAANKQAVEEMRLIHGLPLWAAEKQGKEAHISLLNSDFQTGRVLILKDTNAELIVELETLIWSQRDLLLGKHKEDARKDNHLTDALLYAHHDSRHFWYEVKKVINPNNEDLIRKNLMEQHFKRLNINNNEFEVNYEGEI